MKKLFFLVIAVIALLIGIYYFNCHTKQRYPFITIQSFAQVQDELDRCPSDALILFDIDETILSSPDNFPRAQFFPWWFRLRLVLAFPQFLRRSNWEQVYSLMWQHAPRVLIEPGVVSIIKKLLNRGCSVLGLTAMDTGAYGVIPDMPVWRVHMLKDMGILFSTCYPNQTFYDFSPYRNQFPQLFDGILCANHQPKGKVLSAFLDANQLSPSRIIFFDDIMHNLQSVGEWCAKRAIPCTLFYCRGADKSPIIWNTERFLKQIEMLIKEKRWMGDHEIGAIAGV